MNDKELVVNINKHSNMLIIGKAATSYSLNSISYEDDLDDVIKKYGESDLSDAFKIAKEADVEYIFLMNVRRNQDYLEVADSIKQNDFTYIVPINLMMTDTFFDSANDDREVSYIQYMMEEIGSTNESVFIVTDKHASLYEDIDAFIGEMNSIASDFNTYCDSSVNRENILFVANNLAKYKMANIILASALCTTDISLYPTANFGEAIFDIDEYDDVGNYAYFRNRTLRKTTIENMLNFLHGGPEKIITVSRILKLIKREVDFSEFVGRQYSEYQRMRVERKLELYLDALMEYAIYNYDIVSVQAYRDMPGTVSILNQFDVWPINSLEKCTIETEVTFG